MLPLASKNNPPMHFPMNKLSRYTALSLFVFTLFLGGCRKEEAPHTTSTPSETEEMLGADRYVLMTYKSTTIPAGPMKGLSYKESYISYFDHLPTSDGVNNILERNTLFGRFGSDGGGLLEAYGQLYRYSNAVNNHAQGDLLINNPVRLTFSPSAQAIGERAYLESDAGGFSQAEKNFAIGEQLGFLIQPPVIDRIIEVTTFDPKTMAKLPAKILISEADKERIRQFILEKTPALSGQQLPRLVLGMKLMVLHEGTLIMDAELQSDAQTNLSRDCYLVAYEAKNGGRLLSLSYLPNTGRLGTPSELLQYAHDEAGDLYLLAQGGDLLGFYQNSLIYRIRHGSHEVDPDWQVKISDLGLSYPARFNGIYVYQGKLLTMVSAHQLSAIRSEIPQDEWQYYTIDLATRHAEPIASLRPSSAFRQGVNIATVIDGRLYLRYVRTSSEAPYNGYYTYDVTTGHATPAFSVALQSGYVADFKKITLTPQPR